MRSRSLLGSLSRPFLAGSVMSSSQLLVELAECDVVASFVGGTTSTDRCRFGLCRFVDRVATFLRRRTNRDLALRGSELDQLAPPDARLLLNCRGHLYVQLAFNNYRHNHLSLGITYSTGSIAKMTHARYPRPTNGIFVAITVINRTLDSSGRPAI